MCLDVILKTYQDGSGKGYKVALRNHRSNELTACWIHPACQKDAIDLAEFSPSLPISTFYIFNLTDWNVAVPISVYKHQRKVHAIVEAYTSGFHLFAHLTDAQTYAQYFQNFGLEIWEIEYKERTLIGYECPPIIRSKPKLKPMFTVVANQIKFIQKID